MTRSIRGCVRAPVALSPGGASGILRPRRFVPKWRNWQTRTFEGRVGQPVGVRVPPSAPTPVSSHYPWHKQSRRWSVPVSCPPAVSSSRCPAVTDPRLPTDRRGALTFTANRSYGFAMDRRRFLLNSLASALAAPLAAGAQPAGKVYRIGFLGPGTPITFAPGIEALRLGLRDHGYVEGRNITIKYRWAENRYERLPELAAELVRLTPDVIITQGTPNTFAAKRATSTIPIVMSIIGNPVETGSSPALRTLAVTSRARRSSGMKSPPSASRS